MNRLMIPLIALSLAAGSALASPTQIAHGNNGQFLTDKDGMTLYIFDKDTDGVSNCAGDCLVKWPVLPASDSDKTKGDYGVIRRADGVKQWTYKGMPLYTFFKDTETGDIKGDGVKGVWHLARP